MTAIPTFPRYGKYGVDRAYKVHSEERICGVRAPYHVYYRMNGKNYYDVAYVREPEAALDWVRKALGKKVEILGVVKTEQIEGLKPWSFQ